MSFPFPYVGQWSCLYRHPLEIYPDYVISHYRAGGCGYYPQDFLYHLRYVFATCCREHMVQEETGTPGTYQSGNAATQIDFILYRRSFRKQVSNVKIILGEECASQHRLLVGDFRVSIPPQPKRKFFVPRIKVWKLRDPGKQAELSEVYKAKPLDSELSKTSIVDEHWTSLKDKLLQATKQVCGVSSNHPWRKQTWWWNNKVEEAVREKRRCFKLWKAGGSRAAYNTAKRTSNRAVHQARSEAEKVALHKNRS